MSHEVVTTPSGALAMRCRETGETMHPGVGPIVEAEALYVQQSRLAARLAAQSPPLVLFDIGLGAGSNALAARAIAEAAAPGSAPLHIVSFERETGEKIDAKGFKAFFDLLTVQRKLKDAGRFEFIHRIKGNPGFLASIPASLRYVKAAFDKQPELWPLRKLVAGYVPELA